MQAVQKLALVVILGLTALATLLVIYLADEGNRREAEANEQEEVAIERGIELYIANCLQCHGPAGEGRAFGEPGRIGAPLGGNSSKTAENQSEDPAVREEQAQVIRNSLHQGKPAGCAAPGDPECIMPVFAESEGGTLNGEQIEELILMIQNVDWNHVYNETVAEAGGYPTAPATEAPEQAPTAAGGSDPAAVELSSPGIQWSTNALTVPAGGTINLFNDGSGGPHNFAIEGFNDDEPVDMPAGETVAFTLPPELAPGEYVYYCAIPGHRATMQGKLTVEAPAAAQVPSGPSGQADAALAQTGSETTRGLVSSVAVLPSRQPIARVGGNTRRRRAPSRSAA